MNIFESNKKKKKDKLKSTVRFWKAIGFIENGKEYLDNADFWDLENASKSELDSIDKHIREGEYEDYHKKNKHIKNVYFERDAEYDSISKIFVIIEEQREKDEKEKGIRNLEIKKRIGYGIKIYPLYGTIYFSERSGMQFQSPVKIISDDIMESFNEVKRIGWDQIEEEPGSKPAEKKIRQMVMNEIAQNKRREYERKIKIMRRNERNCILKSYLLVEAYINGVAWDHVMDPETKISEDEKSYLKDESNNKSTLKKIMEYPEIVKENKKEDVFVDDEDPFWTFIQGVKPFRDSLVHFSPFDHKPKKGVVVDKERYFGDTDTIVSKKVIENCFSIIERIHSYLDKPEDRPVWLPEFGEGRLQSTSADT